MGLGDLFSLAKLTIEAFSDQERQTPVGTPFEVQYNPETFSVHHESVFAGGNQADTTNWSYSRPKRLAITLVFDGTNVEHFGVELLFGGIPTVAEQINKFLSKCYQVTGTIHQPLFLKLSWGKALGGFVFGETNAEPAFKCLLQSVDVTYKTFDRDGEPLHAELAAVFVEHLDPPTAAQQAQKSSPDLTHRRVVVDGDTLPLLCREIYGSATHYLRVAQVNALDDFRNLTPGQELIFPPFDRAPARRR
jgi:LysM repeat protein